MAATTQREQALQLLSLSSDWPDLYARAEAVLARTASNEFRVAVVGEFKRGKSTLLNALIGRALLPTGILPVTAVPIEVAAGDDRAVVCFADHTQQDVPIDEVKRFTTESENPSNRLGVTKVCVTVQSDVLRQGLTLVDVPGMGSVHETATEIALMTYDKVDGAVLVLSMDSPLSATERRSAADFETRGARLFIVVNKIDGHDRKDRDEVRRFVAAQLGHPLEDVYCLSARAAIGGGSDEAGDYVRFRTALDRFVSDDLLQAREDVLTRELSFVRSVIRERANLELIAGALDVDELESKMRALDEAIASERARYDGDRRAIIGEVAALAAKVRARLLDEAERGYAEHKAEVIANLSEHGTLYAARAASATRVEATVRKEFERIWAEEAAWLDSQWSHLVERHRGETELRLRNIRAVARELFDIELSLDQSPTIERRENENLYYFPPSMSLTTGLVDPLRRLVPVTPFRRRVEAQASQSLRQEFTKHAGRAGQYLQERLEESWREFDRSMQRYITSSIDGLLDALDRASKLHQQAAENVEQRRAYLERVTAETAAMADS